MYHRILMFRKSRTNVLIIGLVCLLLFLFILPADARRIKEGNWYKYED